MSDPFYMNNLCNLDTPKGRAYSYINTYNVERAFRDNYTRYEYSFIEFYAEHLCDLSRAFKGDMQMVLLLATVAQVALRADMIVENSGGRVQELPPSRRGITTYRLADVTGIPRETTRRKLTAMEKMGWLTRENNFWCLAYEGDDAKIHQDLADVIDRSFRRAARFYVAVTPLVNS
ncbi:hypothetical protein B998_03049 [Brucella sp. F96/2]|uniref:hypothetical protein n=1 Tax=Brucella sp. F96/2 TaxID=437671 RepID=UPI0002CF9F38|nr:hypothetical protein [Brucella sp. F96/2]ENT12879.1 hypothetical protein B998_03049 [Brucella sp. F96/2]